MNRIGIVLIGLCVILSMSAGCGGGAVGQGDVSPKALMRYLKPLDLDRPAIASKAARALNAGKQFREVVTDRKDRRTGLTIRLDRAKQDVLYIKVYRDDTCPDCKGTGRDKKFKFVEERNLPMAFKCLKCDGTGVLKNNLTEKQYVLSATSYVDVAAAEERMETEPYVGAPPQTQGYVEMMGGNDPRARLQAAIWLDQNYVRPGVFFREYMPLLNRARTIAPDPDGKHDVYQFWAGKGIRGQEARAYWRIYVEKKSGNVAKTAFAR